MNLASVSQMEKDLLVPTYERQPVLLERGQGVYVWDSTGKKYLDFLSGIGVNALGHNHPAIQKVIRRQAGRLIHTSNLFYHEYQAELAQRSDRNVGPRPRIFLQQRNRGVGRSAEAGARVCAD